MGLLLLGTIGTGKSTAMTGYIGQDLRAGRSVTLIDPMGPVYDKSLARLCYLKAIGLRTPEVILCNPSDGLVTPYNPFAWEKEGDLGVAVDRRVTAILRAWGQASSDDTPRLERWLRCLLTVLIECGLTLVDAGFLLDQKSAAIRQQFAAALHNPLIRAKFEALSSYKPAEFNEQVESVENRLLRFLSSDSMRRMLGTGKNALDFRRILDSGAILLVKAQPSAFLSREQQRLFCTLILTELYEAALQRPSGAPQRYVYVDEAHRFVTPELAEALETTRQKGLHFCLTAQHLSQFKTKDGDDRVYKAIKNCMRNKVVFAVPDRADAADIADDVFFGLSAPEVKFVRRSLNHLIEDVRDQSTTRAGGRSRSWETSSTRSTGSTANRGRSLGNSTSSASSTSRENSRGRSRTFTRGQNSQQTTGTSRSESEHESHNHGFSETRATQRGSSRTSSDSETVHEHRRSGWFASAEEAGRSVSTGGSENSSQSERATATAGAVLLAKTKPRQAGRIVPWPGPGRKPDQSAIRSPAQPARAGKRVVRAAVRSQSRTAAATAKAKVKASRSQISRRPGTTHSGKNSRITLRWTSEGGGLPSH